jgi:hypothetical protein
MNCSAPVILARSAGRMWLGAPALALLFTYSAAHAATLGTEDTASTAALTKALLRTVETSAEQPVWTLESAQRAFEDPAQAAPVQTGFGAAQADTQKELLAQLRIALPLVQPHSALDLPILVARLDAGHSTPPIAAP